MIYFAKTVKPKSVQEVVDNMVMKALPTYRNPDTTSLQCSIGAHRSFEDILKTCRTYFPDVSEEEVAYHCLNYPTGGPDSIVCLNCPDIEKVVIFKDSGYEDDSGDWNSNWGKDFKDIFDRDYGDEKNIPEKGEYSFEMIWNLSQEWKKSLS